MDGAPFFRVGGETGPNGVSIVVLSGELDLCSGHVLERFLSALLTSGESLLVLDMTEVRYMDCAGMKVLLDVGETLSDRGGALVLAGVSRRVLRVLELTGMAERLPTFPSVNAALAALAER